MMNFITNGERPNIGLLLPNEIIEQRDIEPLLPNEMILHILRIMKTPPKQLLGVSEFIRTYLLKIVPSRYVLKINKKTLNKKSKEYDHWTDLSYHHIINPNMAQLSRFPLKNMFANINHLHIKTNKNNIREILMSSMFYNNQEVDYITIQIVNLDKNPSDVSGNLCRIGNHINRLEDLVSWIRQDQFYVMVHNKIFCFSDPDHFFPDGYVDKRLPFFTILTRVCYFDRTYLDGDRLILSDLIIYDKCNVMKVMLERHFAKLAIFNECYPSFIIPRMPILIEEPSLVSYYVNICDDGLLKFFERVREQHNQYQHHYKIKIYLSNRHRQLANDHLGSEIIDRTIIFLENNIVDKINILIDKMRKNQYDDLPEIEIGSIRTRHRFG